ncbi:hypothetical protein BDQ12DRAFT_676911 [Crucibulum laeve]|uniref:Rad60/SUMO-like domain-containing protein n=1 Tax=Crucibulum laeve TaxID=68775 RepID=A0A5C3MBT4_9AGAR|nr:hypothetical protein BDQ12DRAFT_676911 [Crucibulum laeve]
MRRVKIPTDPFKLEQYRKVELLKMRHRAVPCDPNDKVTSVPITERLHIEVRVEDKSVAERLPQAFWFRKTVGVGKALDLLMLQLKLLASCSMYKVTPEGEEERVLLANDRPLVEQVEDGCTVILQAV